MFFTHRNFSSALLISSSIVLAGTLPGQQQLTPIFSIDADGPIPWFASDGTTRGMTLNPKGNLLVVDREPKNAIYALDPATGFQVGELKTSSISGGTLPLNKIDATSDGRIIVCNLAAESSHFKVYYYSNEFSNPVRIFDIPDSPGRWGDDICVTGVGTRIQIAVSGSANDDILIISDPNGDGVFTSETITPINPSLTGTNNLAFGLDMKSLWIRQSTGGEAGADQYSLEGGIGSGRSTATLPAMGPIDMVYMDNSAILGVSPGLIKEETLEIKAHIINTDRSSISKWATPSLKASSGQNANVNGSGDIMIDPLNRRVYVLLTNNTISGWSIPFQ